MSKHRGVLTPLQRRILMLALAGEEIVYSKGEGYVGFDLTFSSHTFYALLRLCAISQDSVGEIYWHINGTGKKLLKGDVSDLQIVLDAMKGRKLRLCNK